MSRERLKRIIPTRHRAFILRMISALKVVTGVRAIARLYRLNRADLKAVNLSRRSNRVLFTTENLSWRERKLAYGLKRAGWDVVLLSKKAPPPQQADYFADVQLFKSPYEAAELAYKAECPVVHAFSIICDDTTLQMVRRKPARVIADLNDDLFSFADGLPEQERKYARDIAGQAECIQKADALCCRDLQLQYRRERTGIGRGKKLILFPEYCWNNEELPPRRGNDVHIVQVGYMRFETQGETDLGCFLVAEKLVRAGCHFHIYVHPHFPPLGSGTFNAMFRDYLALGEETGRVHIHPTVPADQLIRELSQYDFGFNMLNGLSFPGIAATGFNATRSPYCGSSRMYDYLDAGLGMLADSKLSFMRHTFGFSGAFYDGTALIATGRIRETLAIKPSRQALLQARETLAIDNQIHRLTRFYEALR